MIADYLAKLREHCPNVKSVILIGSVVRGEALAESLQRRKARRLKEGWLIPGSDLMEGIAFDLG